MEKWFGFDMECFEFEGKEAIIVFPEEPEENRNWTIKPSTGEHSRILKSIF